MLADGLSLPDIRAGDLDDRQERRRILEYLYQLTEQLRYMLSHIGTENLDVELKTNIVTITRAEQALSQKQEDAEGRASALRQTVGGLTATVTSHDTAISGLSERMSTAELRITDEAIVSTVTQSEAYQDDLGYRMDVIAGTAFLTRESPSTTLSARVWHGGEDVTDALDAARFLWHRTSADGMADSIWNEAHAGVKSVEITTEDVRRQASFRCELTDE